MDMVKYFKTLKIAFLVAGLVSAVLSLFGYVNILLAIVLMGWSAIFMGIGKKYEKK